MTVNNSTIIPHNEGKLADQDSGDEKHEAVQNFIMVDLHKDPDMLEKLAQVILNK